MGQLAAWLPFFGGILQDWWNRDSINTINQQNRADTQQALARLDAVNIPSLSNRYGSGFSFGGAPVGDYADPGATDLRDAFFDPLRGLDSAGTYTRGLSSLFDSNGNFIGGYDPSGYGGVAASLRSFQGDNADFLRGLYGDAESQYADIIGQGTSDALSKLQHIDPGSLFASVQSLLPEYTGDEYRKSQIADLTAGSRTAQQQAQQQLVASGLGSGMNLQELTAGTLPLLQYQAGAERARGALGVESDIEQMKQQTAQARFGVGAELAAKEADINAFVDSKMADLVAGGAYQAAEGLRLLNQQELEGLRVSSDNLMGQLAQLGVAGEEAKRLTQQFEAEFINNVAAQKSALGLSDVQLNSTAASNAVTALLNMTNMLGGFDLGTLNAELQRAGMFGSTLQNNQTNFIPFQNYGSLFSDAWIANQMARPPEQPSGFQFSVDDVGFGFSG